MSNPPDGPISPETVVPALAQAIGQILRRLRAEANPGGLSLSQTAAPALLEESDGLTNAFTKTGLETYLRSLEVTQAVLVGVATSNGVEVTARRAYELGFNVTLVTDAMTDMKQDAHAWSVTRVFPRIGETGTTQEIIDLLKRST